MRWLYTGIIAGLLSAPNSAMAGALLDYLRDYDLNDYSLGVAFTTEQNPFVGTKAGAYAYPYLTSFHDSTLTDDWFFILDGDIGGRWISGDSKWEIGGVLRIETRGLGNSESNELLGIEDRKWTVEAGPVVSWRGWPIHIGFKAHAEVTGRHDGLTSQLVFSLPLEWTRGFLVPNIEVIHQSQDYVNYYYGVSPDEATPERPAYSTRDAINILYSTRWAYALTDKWLLSGRIGLEQLDSEITDSPIVDRDQVWSARIGIAYNADIFQPRDYGFSDRKQPRFEVRVGAFYDIIDSKVARDTADGVPGTEIDIEEFLGVPDQETVWQLESIIRFGNYHRLEFGYFELSRDASTTLTSDISFGDQHFPAGTEISSRIEVRIFRAAYAYSLIKDDQKEFGVMAGVHVANFDTEIVAAATGQRDKTRAGTPLPVLGLHASIELGEKNTLGARLQTFRLDFDSYEGSLNFFAIDVQYRLTDGISVGLGYNYYRMKLDSNDSDVEGYFELQHHGPVVFLSALF